MAFLVAGNPSDNLTVMTPYTAQATLLNTVLAGTNVKVGTIDAFQGSENDIVIISVVRANHSGNIGFNNDCRVNVAVTRAKRGLVVCGNWQTLR
jgi:superfamily I DNA and/or RNA helicase